MSSKEKGKQNLKSENIPKSGYYNNVESKNIHKSGYYNKEISHNNYDTWQVKHTIELNNSLDDLVIMAINEIKEWYRYKVNETKDINKVDYENSLDDLIEYINYDGSLNEIIDGCVPIYTHDLKGLFFINEDALDEAFENMGLGVRSDYENKHNEFEGDNYPLGFEGVAIYCYIENEINIWLSDSLENWFSSEFWTVF